MPGDILLNCRSATDLQHVVIFAGWADAAHTQYVAYEETPPVCVKHVVPYPYWTGDEPQNYAPYRYNGFAVPKPYAVTLSLSAAQVAVNRSVTYSGTVTGAAGSPAQGQVTVQRRPAAGGSWSNWRSATLDAGGHYAVAVQMTSAPRDWQFRTRMPGDGVHDLTACSAIQGLTVMTG